MATGRTGSSGYIVTGGGAKKDWRPQGVVKVTPGANAETTFGPPKGSESGGIVAVTRRR